MLGAPEAQKRAIHHSGKVVHKAGDALFDAIGAEVQQQAEPLVRKPDVGEQLLLVDRQQVLDGLELDDDEIVDDQVSTKSDVELESS